MKLMPFCVCIRARSGAGHVTGALHRVRVRQTYRILGADALHWLRTGSTPVIVAPILADHPT
jgi:hypothetical protein